MKISLNIILPFIMLGLTTSCFDNDKDDNLILVDEINDFVWKGMNAVYLYKDNVPDLANDRFSSNQEYANYLNGFSSPEDIFESLIYQRETVDRFSWIVDDFIALEQLFSGVTTSNGMEFNLFFAPNSTTEVFGVIRLVLPNSDAGIHNLKRGDIFYAIDGTPLTENNFSGLLNQDTYTVNLGTFNDNGTAETTDDTIDPGTESITLNKVPFTENPVFRTETIDTGGEKIGYLMYNGFTSNFDNQLNNAFGELRSNNVQHLVLDLRYNPGGSVNTATLLGSMVTGQFNGDVFTKLIYNNDLQSNNTSFNFTNTLNDGSAINSLNLDKVYVLTTNRSASASEMVINSLRAHLSNSNVVQIGTTTTGKSQASITIYDSPDFGRDGANPNHTYAMQPLVAIGVNKNDEQVPSSGLVPTIELKENPFNYGVLGNENEPLLAAAIANILGTGRSSIPISQNIKLVGDSNDFIPFKGGMIIDNKVLQGHMKRLQFNQ